MTELPQVETEPGSARPFYTGHPRTEMYVLDAQRALGEVLFDDTVPPDRVLSPQAVVNQDGYRNMLAVLSDEASAISVGVLPGDGDGSSQHRPQYTSGSTLLAERRSNDKLPAAVQADELGALPPQSDQPRFQTFNAPQNSPPPSSNTSARDDLPSSSLQIGLPAAPGGRFATFPVKSKRKSSLVLVNGEPQDNSKSTLAEEVENALTEDVDDPAPRYETIEGVHTPPPAPPPGAAPPTMPQASLYGSSDPGAYDSGPSYVPENAGKEEESQLAYMEPPQSERRVRYGSRPIQMPRPLSSEEPNSRAQISTESDPRNYPAQSPLASSPVSLQASAPQDRIPSPPYAAEEPEDERSLSAAAAREVSRELDALMYSPPAIQSRDSNSVSLSIPPAAHPSPRSSTSSIHPSPFSRTRGGRTAGSPTAPRGSAEQSPSNTAPPSQPTPSAPSSPTQQALPQPSIALPPSSPPSLSSVGNSPFRTPPEFPSSASSANSQRPLPQPPAVPTPGKSPSLPPPGARTISAAAFRRPMPRMASEPLAGTPETSPLSIKKRDLLSSPDARRFGGVIGTGSTSSLPSVPPLEPSVSQPQERLLEEDEFDYISAYYSSGGDDVMIPPTSIIEPRGRSGSLR
jgi:hypothetical protein